MIDRSIELPRNTAAAPTDQDSELEQQVFAAVDLGSNSFHLIVARQEHGQLQVIDRLREMVRLAGGLGEDGTLSEAAQDRALACLARFGERLSGIPSEHVRALATNTLRRVQDPKPFLLVAEIALGHPIEIISGHEEARLVYLGVAQDLPVSGKRRLVIDIGGGSTELIVGKSDRPEIMDTISVGCVNISQRFFADGKITKPRLKEAQTAVALECRPIRDTYRGAGWEEAVGSSGTVRAVERVLRESGWGSETGITRQGLKRLRRALEEIGRVSRLDLPGLSEERRAVFPGGVAVLSACFRNVEIQQMATSEYALREGAIYDLLGRVRHKDPREASVSALAKRYGVDMDQAARVRGTALRAFAQVSGSWELGEHLRGLIGWAAQLHEVGLAIAHTDYHRHGAYLAQHSTLNGFSREEQLILSVMILGHRKKLTIQTAATLPERLQGPVTRSCILLRLSVLLHRSRQADDVPPVSWKAGDNQLTLAFPNGWLADHPLTHEDLARERDYLQRVGISLTVG